VLQSPEGIEEASEVLLNGMQALKCSLYYLFLLLCCFCCSLGCKQHKVVANGFGVGRISTFVEIAQNANPQPPVVKECLTGIKTELPLIKQILEADAGIIADQQVEIAKKDSKLLGYKYQFVGDRTWFYARWIIGIWVALAIVGSTLVTLTGGVGFWGVLGKNIVWLLPLANPFRWLSAIVKIIGSQWTKR
jgi:hypothetical protein